MFTSCELGALGTAVDQPTTASASGALHDRTPVRLRARLVAWLSGGSRRPADDVVFVINPIRPAPLVLDLGA
jgi:hypothetical protein